MENYRTLTACVLCFVLGAAVFFAGYTVGSRKEPVAKYVPQQVPVRAPMSATFEEYYYSPYPMEGEYGSAYDYEE